jgi:signal transduction histidine kinase
MTPRQKLELELISAVGHDLRSPLTVIRGAATLLLQAHGQMPAERQLAMLRLIEQHTETMSELVEELITAAHLDAGDLDLRLEPVEVAPVLEEVVDWARRQDASRPILVLGPAPGLAVRADPERTAQVLRALVGNAFAQAPDSDVEILVEDQPDSIRIGVLDRGSDVPAAQRKRLFDRLSQPPERGGPRLGLYVARGLARAMGGDVTFEGRSGGGSALWFTLGRSA